jgi:colanic acid biosynthesis glycosyl transferase WcaI
MPSKLTTILSVGGLAIIAANETSNLYEVISKYELGVIIEPENSPALINAIKNMLADGQTKISLNARNYAEELLSIEHIFQLYAVNMQ